MTNTREQDPSRTDAAPLLSPHEERRVAVHAAVDPRTLRRYLVGEPIVSTCRARIERALEELGLSSLVLGRQG
jgi:hypothetical protein